MEALQDPYETADRGRALPGPTRFCVGRETIAMHPPDVPPVRRLASSHASPPMNDQHPPGSLLDELDQRQNEVLQQLDDLDRRLESLLRDCMSRRPTTQEAAVARTA